MTRRVCFFCGKKNPAIRSSFTGRYFCVDFPACSKRAKRKKVAA